MTIFTNFIENMDLLIEAYRYAFGQLSDFEALVVLFLPTGLMMFLGFQVFPKWFRYQIVCEILYQNNMDISIFYEMDNITMRGTTIVSPRDQRRLAKSVHFDSVEKLSKFYVKSKRILGSCTYTFLLKCMLSGIDIDSTDISNITD